MVDSLAPLTGQDVNFDASGTHDPVGTVNHYEWDLDGDGTFETDTGTSPLASHVYAVMVVQPRMRYYREKVADFDAADQSDPWRLKFQAQHRRSTRVAVLGLALAVWAVLLG